MSMLALILASFTVAVIDIATYPLEFHMIHYTQIIWEEVAFSWKVTGKAVATYCML